MSATACSFQGFKKVRFVEVPVKSEFWNTAGPEFGCQFVKTSDQECVGLTGCYKKETLRLVVPGWIVWIKT